MNFQRYFPSLLTIVLCTCCAMAGCSCTPDKQAEVPPSQQKKGSVKPTSSAGMTPPKPAASGTAKNPEKKDAPVGGTSPSGSPSPTSSPPAQPPNGTADQSSFGGVLSTLFGGAPSGEPSSRSRRSDARILSPKEAAVKARKLISEADEYSGAGKAGAAFKSGVSAYELLAPHSGDDECRGLLAALEPQLRRYADAANAEPIAPSKPSSIR